MKRNHRICAVFLLLLVGACLLVSTACKRNVPPQWEENTCTVTFDPNGGAMEASEIHAAKGTAIELSQFMPARAGHTFTGWQLKDDSRCVFSSDATVTVEQNMTLIAQWVANTVYYEVCFDTAGGAFTTNVPALPLRVKAGAQLPLSDYIPQRAGYTFIGWEKGATLYSLNAQWEATASVTFKAKWSPLPRYTVTFDAFGGTLQESATVGVTAGESLALADFIPTREGYTFVAWQTADGTAYGAESTITPTADMTLVAVWQRIPSDTAHFIFTATEDGEGVVLSGLASGSPLQQEVVVPGSYEGKPVREIARGVFSYLDAVTAIDLSQCRNLIKIESSNFNHCDNLTEVSLWSCASLEEIGSSCFNNCPKLVTVDLNGLTALRSIGSHCFYGYNGSESGGMPIAVLDFTSCVSLVTIDQGCFWYLPQLITLDFSHTRLESVGRQCIWNCGALETILLSEGLQVGAIGSEFLTLVGNLKEIVVPTTNIFLCTVDGVLYDADQTECIKAPSCGGLVSCTMPATVKIIRSRAFYEVQTLTFIDLTACTLAQVGWECFAHCQNAEIRVPFTENGKQENGDIVTPGARWNADTGHVVYRQLVEITVNGVQNGQSVTDSALMVEVVAAYGARACAVSVLLNGQEVPGSGSQYMLPLAMGGNIVLITASEGEHTAALTLTVTRVAGNPTMSTTLSNPVVSWYGNAVEFDMMARDAAGNALPVEAVEIYYDFGFGEWRQSDGVTLTLGANDLIHASVCYDDFYDMGFFDGDIDIMMTVVVRDGELTARGLYTIHWQVSAPLPTLETSLVDGTISDYDTPVTFTLRAKSAAGQALGASHISITLFWGYAENAPRNMTITDMPDGTVTVTVDLSEDAEMGMFWWEDADITLTVVVSDGNAETSLSYTIRWVEN